MVFFRSLRSREQSNRDGRLLLQAQLPFLAALAGIAVFLLVANRSYLGRPEVIVSFALAVAATLAAVFVPWAKISTRWLIGLSLLDILAVAILRDATTGALAGVGILVVFPVLWLAYSFSTRVLSVAVLGALFLVAYPFLRAGSLPSSTEDWGNVIVVPVTVTFIAIAVHIAAQQFRAQRRSLKDTRITTEAVANNVDAGVMVLDTEDRIVLINQPARDIIEKSGVTPESRSTDDLLVYEEDGTTLAGIHRNSFGNSLRQEDVDRVLLVGESGGDQSAFATTSHNIVRDSGELVGTVVVAHDVTVFVDAAHDREEFLQTMSHELRTPLTSILGYLEVIADTIDAENVGIADELDVIKRNSDRLNALVSALLSVASGPRPTVRRSTDLAATVHQSLGALAKNAETARVQVVPLEVATIDAECDPTRIRQLIDNLISNAIKYSPAGASVEVSLTRHDDEAVLTVTDGGYGISEGDRDRVFDRFFRGDAARKHAVQGVGIGLTIVKEAVEVHGGTVVVDSEVGTGTTVTVRLPLHAEA